MISYTPHGPDTTPAPISTVYNEAYWSRGWDEKRHVFIDGNNLTNRLNSMPFCIGELGFGTGLSFLLATRLAQDTGTPLTYIGYELHPLTRADMADIHRMFPDDVQEISGALLAQYAPVAGWNTMTIGRVTLQLFVGDVVDGLPSHPHMTDAWFLDGFSPANNPDMWNAEVMALVGQHTVPHGTASTYTVARAVRENLTAAGFEVAKVKGFFPKWQMVVAMKTS